MMAPPPYGADLPMPNIDRFDRYVAAILGQLYGEFPVKVDLDVRRLTGHTATNADGEICAPDGSVSEEAAVAYGTIEWLIETGYVRAIEPRHGICFRSLRPDRSRAPTPEGHARQRHDPRVLRQHTRTSGARRRA